VNVIKEALERKLERRGERAAHMGGGGGRPASDPYMWISPWCARALEPVPPGQAPVSPCVVCVCVFVVCVLVFYSCLCVACVSIAIAAVCICACEAMMLHRQDAQ